MSMSSMSPYQVKLASGSVAKSTSNMIAVTIT